MQKNMLGVALRDVRGPLADLNEKLAGESGDDWLTELNKFLRKEPCWTQKERTSTEAQLANWVTLYCEEFGITINPSDIKIPERKPGFDRLIVVANGITINRAYEACEKKFPCWRYVSDLDKNIPTNDRIPTETYAVWIRDRAEADEEIKNLSAEDLANQKIGGITLLERILLELEYFRETGKHLDVQNVTLCSGSRDSGGNVPSASCRDGRFRVHWCGVGCARPYLRARAVSL
jgi:hypothetical protein